MASAAAPPAEMPTMGPVPMWGPALGGGDEDEDEDWPSVPALAAWPWVMVATLGVEKERDEAAAEGATAAVGPVLEALLGTLLEALPGVEEEDVL